MKPVKLLIGPTSVLALSLIFSGVHAGANSPAGGSGGGIVGVTIYKKVIPADSPGVFRLADRSETIEFVGKGKVKVTQNGVAFVSRCRVADGLVTFLRTPGGKRERFRRSGQVLIHQDSGIFYYDEPTLASREEFHRRVKSQLDSSRSF